MDGISERFGEYRKADRTAHSPNEDAQVRSSGVGSEQANTFTRFQIHAVISGEISSLGIGPELVDRLHRLCLASGKHLHSLQVEVVQMPVSCPECGQDALYRCHRKGFLQSRLYPLLGLFPWNCTYCRRSFLLKRRHPRVLHTMSPKEAAPASSRRAA